MTCYIVQQERGAFLVHEPPGWLLYSQLTAVASRQMAIRVRTVVRLAADEPGLRLSLFFDPSVEVVATPDTGGVLDASVIAGTRSDGA